MRFFILNKSAVIQVCMHKQFRNSINFLEPIKFWAGMDEMGLLSDLTDVMITSMEHLRRLALMGPSQRDAGKSIY